MAMSNHRRSAASAFTESQDKAELAVETADCSAASIGCSDGGAPAIEDGIDFMLDVGSVDDSVAEYVKKTSRSLMGGEGKTSVRLRRVAGQKSSPSHHQVATESSLNRTAGLHNSGVIGRTGRSPAPVGAACHRPAG